MADASLSSPEPDEADEENPRAAWSADHANEPYDHQSPSSGNEHSLPTDSARPSISGPATASQKRRRVTRACDECRRKKIKCDGRQPCTHCTVYSYECTYDQPSNRRRNPPPQYIEALENRVQRAEALLQCFLPDLDLSEASVEKLLEQGPSTIKETVRSALQRNVPAATQPFNEDLKSDTELESMVRTTGLLDLDEHGHWDYTGNSAGRTFLQSLKMRFGVTPDPMEDGSIAPSGVASKSLKMIETPKLSYPESPPPSTAPTAELPSKEIALDLCDHGLDDAMFILACVHKPSFYKQLDRIYDTPHELYKDEDHKFLPLLYMVIALGRLFAKDAEGDLKRSDYKSAMDDAYGYFWTARQLLDIAECRDLTSLQAIVFMSLFLQSTAKLSTCYAYVGAALRSALRMGLHRSFRDSFSPIEAELRKRCFWVIRRMDIHVGAMLGMPILLSDDDIDQEYPVEVDDEYITEDRILPMPDGQVSVMTAANHLFRLSEIVSKIVRYIYPIKNVSHLPLSDSKTYSVSFGKIREIENDLHRWKEVLNDVYKPGDKTESAGNIRIQRLLRMSYAYAQMLLYRPFLHYVSSQSQSKHVDQVAYICSAACISVSQNTCQITVEMMKQGSLPGSYWITMYTTFFAVLSLVYFVRENPSDANNKKIRKDASDGRAILAKMAKRSWAADRCSLTLNALFASLPEVATNSPSSSSDHAGSKRRSMLTKTELLGRREKTFRSQVDPDEKKLSKQSKRANTFPQHASKRENGIPSPSYPQFPVQDQNHLESSYQGTPVSLNYASPTGSPESAISPADPFAMFQNQVDFQPQNQQQDFIPPQHQNLQNQSNLSEVSALMFPSTDPFAYPNQPLGSYEQISMDKQILYGGAYGPGDSTFVTLPGTVQCSVTGNEALEGQLFNGLPSYYSGSLQPATVDDGMGDFIPDDSLGVNCDTSSNYMRGNGNGLWPHGSSNGAINLNAIFDGGDWMGSSRNAGEYGGQ